MIIVASRPTTEIAIESARLGAFEYLPEPFQILELIELVIKAALPHDGFLHVNAVQKDNSTSTGLIGSSRVMHNLFKHIGMAADSSANVLIRGATGTGKELIARAIHKFSSRRGRAFMALNCTAIPETLFESELFGHEGGAFTGAARQHVGVFEQAQGGTLFLDEIGDLTHRLQAKLLRVLEDRSINRLGGRKPIPLDIKVIAATHRDLEHSIRIGNFREDLFHRLGGLEINSPDLSEHREDIWDLIQHFLVKYQTNRAAEPARFNRDALAFLEAQDWPGNVRQLENTVRRALLLAHGRAITLENVQQACRNGRTVIRREATPLFEPPTDLFEKAEAGQITNLHETLMQQAEQSIFKKAIPRALGNQSKLARLLGITRNTVHDKLVQFGLLKTPNDNFPTPSP